MTLFPKNSQLRPAFTLIELLVVIAIIAILAAILLPSLSKAKDTAHSTTCKNHLRQMMYAMKMYVDDNHSKYPPYISFGSLADAYGDATQPGNSSVNPNEYGIYWSSRLIPYYHLNWTNTAFHCPGYKGAIGAGGGRSGSYCYNTYGVGGPRMGLGNYYFYGYGYDTPVSESEVKMPSEMIAMSDSSTYIVPVYWPSGVAWDFGSGLYLGGSDNSAPTGISLRHGKNYNQVFCDGHVGAMSPFLLFNKTNSASLWNLDHQQHQDWWW